MGLNLKIHEIRIALANGVSALEYIDCVQKWSKSI